MFFTSFEYDKSVAKATSYSWIKYNCDVKMDNEMNIEHNQDIVSAQITKILKSRIFLKTEHGKTIVVEYPRKQRKNHQTKQLFTQILKDIWHHHLWIPVNQRTNQILQYDWLS